MRRRAAAATRSPAINPCSLWDVAFRPACADPRGMTLVTTTAWPFWCDIYLTGVNHLLAGTSRFGETIADGDDCPLDAKGKPTRRFDYATAIAVMAAHGKRLLHIEEFFAAAYGVAERTAIGRNPKATVLDPPRTSRAGLIQATGNLWTWGDDGDPDQPSAVVLGGGFGYGAFSGSRASGWDVAASYSYGYVGARGCCDPL